jgi:hypothetical protein
MTSLVILATVLGCELAARVALDGRGFPSRREERAAFIATIPRQGSTDGAKDPAGALERVNGAAFTLRGRHDTRRASRRCGATSRTQRSTARSPKPIRTSSPPP